MTNTPYRKFLIDTVRENEMLYGCLPGSDSDNSERARGIAELIAVLTPLQEGEDGISAATENILPQLYPQGEPEPLAAWEQHLLNGYAVTREDDGSLYIIRYTAVRDRFDMQDAIEAAKKEFGGGGTVLLSTRWYREDVETTWSDATEVRWHFQKY